MRIGFFTYGMNGQRMTGIARYAVELTRALHALDPKLEIILLNPYPDSEHPWYEEFETYPLPQLRLLPFAVSAGNWLLHRASLKLKLDILHDPCGIAPFLMPVRRYKRITTVHDAIPFIYPETQPLLTRLVFQTLVRAAKHTADAVLTVSEASAADLTVHAGIPKEKLVAIPNGVRLPTSLSQETLPNTLRHFGIRQPYFLYVGALHPRKNLIRVLAAFSRLQQLDAMAQLVIVGPPSWGAHETLQQVLAKVQSTDEIIFTGFVSDESLHTLYAGAHALVFPSLYEGFGLPALEAMAHGIPVITSNVSSLPEVTGEAGILVDPLAIEEITNAMRRLLEDESLRQDLSRRSLERAKLFSWAATAQKTLEVYEQLLA